MRIWLTDEPSGTIWTDFSSPISSGPIRVAPPSASIICVEITAEWIAGMTSTLASRDRRMKGCEPRASGVRASSGGISPSYSKSTPR